MLHQLKKVSDHPVDKIDMCYNGVQLILDNVKKVEVV